MKTQDLVEMKVALGTMRTSIDNHTRILDEVRNLLKVQNGQVRENRDAVVATTEWRVYTDTAIKDLKCSIDALVEKVDTIKENQDRQSSTLAWIKKNGPIMLGVLTIVVYELGLFDLVIGLLT